MSRLSLDELMVWRTNSASTEVIKCPTHSVFHIHTQAPEQRPAWMGASPVEPEAIRTVEVLL